MRKLDVFWYSNKAWFHLNEYGQRVINPDAPPEAQQSYKHYIEQVKNLAKENSQFLSES